MQLLLHAITLDELEKQASSFRTSVRDSFEIIYLPPTSLHRKKRDHIDTKTLFSSSAFLKLVHSVLYVIRTAQHLISVTFVGIEFSEKMMNRLMELASKAPSLQCLSFSQMKIPKAIPFFTLLSQFNVRTSNLALIDMGLSDKHFPLLKTILKSFSGKFDFCNWELSLRTGKLFPNLAPPLILDLSFNSFSTELIDDLTTVIDGSISKIILKGINISEETAINLIDFKIRKCPHLCIIADYLRPTLLFLLETELTAEYYEVLSRLGQDEELKAEESVINDSI
ncbi:hypothetical protein RCL1_004509 [Eukaryota sp. TZLM3-RCL]